MVGSRYPTPARISALLAPCLSEVLVLKVVMDDIRHADALVVPDHFETEVTQTWRPNAARDHAPQARSPCAATLLRGRRRRSGPYGARAGSRRRQMRTGPSSRRRRPQ